MAMVMDFSLPFCSLASNLPRVWPDSSKVVTIKIKRSKTPSHRVGVDFHAFDGIYQGSRSHLLGLFSAAIEMAPHIQFVFFLENTEKLKDLDPAFTQPNVQLVRMKHIVGPVRLAIQLPYLRRLFKVDLLHMQYRIPPISLGPCAVTIHDVLFESHPQFFSKNFVKQSKHTFRFAAKHADLLFSVSEYSKSEISSRYNVLLDKICVLHNAVDRTRFFPGIDGVEQINAIGLETNGYILAVGRLEPRKNHENLLRAYSLLPKDAPPLVIVGQKDFGWEGIFDLVSSLGISDKVQFLHNVGDHALPALMRHALFFVYPSYAEGFGMPVLEAMVSGTAVITTDTTSLPEVAGDCALYIDPNAPKDIAKKIVQLLRNDDLRQTLVEKGLVRAEKFNWQYSADKLVKEYDKYFCIAEESSL